MTNVKIYKRPTYFCASSYRFRYIQILNVWPSKSRSKSQSTIFAVTPFDGKCNMKAQHRSWHTAKCNKLYHMKWNINAWDTAMHLHGHHFVLHIGICNPICSKLLQLISGVITHNSVKNEVSILINGWVIANYSDLQPPFCPPSWNL